MATPPVYKCAILKFETEKKDFLAFFEFQVSNPILKLDLNFYAWKFSSTLRYLILEQLFHLKMAQPNFWNDKFGLNQKNRFKSSLKKRFDCQQEIYHYFLGSWLSTY